MWVVGSVKLLLFIVVMMQIKSTEEEYLAAEQADFNTTNCWNPVIQLAMSMFGYCGIFLDLGV